MRVVIDARMWGESGVGRYIRNLVENLQNIDKRNEYFLILLEKDYQRLNFSKNFYKVLGNFRWYGVSEQVKLPKILNQIKPDLVHFPHFNVPIFYKGKFVVTIHDLIHQKFEMRRATTHDPVVYKIKQLGYKKAFGWALKKSYKVITVSDYVKEELKSVWTVEDKKITVTKEGVEEQLLETSKIVDDKKIKEVISKFNVNQPYIFYVGNAHPHKNVEGLIEAFLTLRKKYQYLQLVLSGNDHYFWKKIKDKYQHKDIIYTGFVSEEELVAFYKGAKAYVVPSFEEGFGIPLLEAMACGCPVVCSNRASLPEVGGDAALYFDPNIEDDLVEKLEIILNDGKLANSLIEKGKKRIKQFSWKKLAEETYKIYTEAVG